MTPFTLWLAIIAVFTLPYLIAHLIAEWLGWIPKPEARVFRCRRVREAGMTEAYRGRRRAVRLVALWRTIK